MPNDDIELELQDEEVQLEAEPQQEEPAYITELRKQLDAEKAARAAAEQKLHQANREAHSARSEADETNLQLVINAIDTVVPTRRPCRTVISNVRPKFSGKCRQTRPHCSS